MTGASCTTFVTSLLFLSAVGSTGVSHIVHRFLRDVQQSSRGIPVSLTPRQQQEVVDAHNAIRRQEMASDMRAMEWHPGLADAAREAAGKCAWTARRREQLRGLVSGFDTLTESVYISARRVNYDEIAKKWADEKDSYEFSTDQCNKVCWHYTQIVWANTHAVGCAVQSCPTVENIPWGKHGGYLYICLYGPGGNTEGMKPYTKGEKTCGNCTGDFLNCLDGLCSKYATPTSITPEVTTKTIVIGSAGRPGSLIGGYLLVFLLFNLLFSDITLAREMEITLRQADVIGS